MKKIRVLIADDKEELLINMRKKIEEDIFFEVVGVARNGKEELDLIKQLNPEVVITDVDMPEYTGIEVVKIIQKQQGYNPEFYILTGNSSVRKECYKLGISNLYIKPVNMDNIIKNIKNNIQNKSINNIEKPTLENKNSKLIERIYLMLKKNSR